MIVRSVDTQNDWTYGKGIEDYKFGLDAIAQSIKTRLQSFLGDCFFAKSDGIDWFNLIGGKNETALQLVIASTILNTQNVTKILQLSILLTAERAFSISFSAQTSLGIVTDETVIVGPVNYLLTQSGDILITEGGEPITI